MKRDQDGQQRAEPKKTFRKFRQIVRENLRLTVRNIAEQVNVDRETVRKILTEDLDMRTKKIPSVRTKSQNNVANFF
jgi:hypothetical protein